MFFIFGSPRSGTTLLAQCLNAHSEIVIPHETDFIVPLIFIYNRIQDPETGRKIMADLVTKSAYRNSVIEFVSAEQLREIIFSTEYHPGKIIDAIYAAIARVMKKRLAGDKSPNDLTYLPRLTEVGFLMPEVKMIHIVRDVRDLMSSLYKTKWLDASNVLFSRLWCHDNLYLHFLFGGKPKQYLLVHYEDMVRDPKGVFKKICAFLDVQFENEMLSPDRRHERYRKMDHHSNLFSPISDDRIGKYREHLTPEQLAGCEFHGREGLQKFGYPLSSEPSVPGGFPFGKTIKRFFGRV